MKTFKRTLSCFLALLMIFGSFSVLSYAALNDGNENTFQVYSKFFVDGEEVTEVKTGDTVKVRAYLKNDYLMSTTVIMFVYPTTFMEFVDDALTLEVSTDTGDRYSLTGGLNASTTSYAGSSNFGGYIQHQEGFVLDSMSPADNLVYDGFVSEDYWDDKGWVAITIDTGTPVKATANSDDDYLAEFTFTVKDSAPADGKGYFNVVADSILTPDNIYGFTCCERSQAGTMFNTAAGDFATSRYYNLDLSLDTNSIELASGEVGVTKYAVTYEYKGDVPESVTTTPEATEAEEGEIISLPVISVPAGYRLTWSVKGATKNADGTYTVGTEAVEMTGTWAKLYPVTYVYAGDVPEGYTAPAAVELAAGDAITEPEVTILDGYTLTWTGIPEGGKMGTEAVTLTGTWAKKSNTVTYVYAGETPDGKTAPEAITLKYGDAITEPIVEIPDGYTLTWTGIPESGKMGLEAVTLTGTWAKKSNTVTYVYAGETPDGKTAPEAITLKYGEAITEPTVEIPDGYTLTWTGIPEGGKMGTEAVTLTGTWAKIEYDVTYAFDGEYPGEAIEPAAHKTTVGATIPAPAVEVPAGWTVEWNVTGATKNADGSYTAGANDVEFVATFSKIDYTITYYLSEQDKADGKVYDTQTYNVDDEIVALAAPEAEAGKSFVGWDFEDSNGIFDETMPMPAENLAAVASWEDIEYYVNFYDVWGDSITELVKYYGDEITDADIPSADDATAGEDVNFVEWQLDGAKFEAPYVVKGDVDVYAYCTVEIVYYADEEMTKVHKTYTFDFAHLITADDIADLGEPTKPGHNFDGWDADYVDQEATANNYAAPTFVPNKYDATFMVDGEVYDTAKDVTFGTAIAAPAADPKLDGYTFKGWTDVEGGEALDELVMDAEGKTFYPVFEMNGSADFSVELYLMNTEGKYDATPTRILPESGLVGVTARADHEGCQQYIDDWFSADTSEEAGNVYEGVIAEDGSTVLKLYYKRAQYDVAIDGAEAVKVFHGATVTAPTESANAPAGYTLESWNDGAYAKGEAITVTGPLTLAPKFAAGTSEYTINTYTMGLDGEYGAAVPETKTYTTDETVTYTAPVVEGFKADKDSYSVKVTGDNKAEINVYYARNKYDVTIDGVTTPTFHGAEVTAPETSTATPAGYVLESWNDGAYAKGEVITVTGPLTLAPKFAAGTSEYTINIYEMGLDGEYGEAKSETKTHTTDETVTYTAPVVEGFKADKESYSVVVTGDNKAEINVYYAREQFDVVINGVSSKAYYGAIITAPSEAANAPAGYHLASWNNGAVALGQEIKVTGPVTLEPKFEANTDTAYTVEIYLMDEYGKYAETADDTDSKTGTTDTIATAAHADYAQEAWFTPAAAGNVTETTITGDGKAVLKLYFERAQYDVTIDGVTNPVYHGAIINAPTATTQTAPAGFAFAGWNNGTIAAGAPITVTGPITLEPYFAENENTPYTVEIYLQNADGTYNAVASETKDETGKTGEEVTIAHADYAQDAKYYLADDAQANEFTGIIAGDGSLVLKLYFKRATYTVAYETEDGTAVGEAAEVRYGAAITAPAYETPAGMTLLGWFDKATSERMPATMPAKDATYVVKFAAGDATPYIIQVNVMDVDGEGYLTTETQALGTTGAIQTIVAIPREGFTVNAEKSNLAAEIAGDGSTVLAVYYDRNLYKATFDGVEYQVYYGASLPTVEPAAREGQEFDKWTPEVPASMPAEDLEFTSTWTEAVYKLIYIINGAEEEYEYAAGAAITPIADPVVPGMTFIKWNKIIPTTMPAEDVIIVAEFEAAVFKATFVDGDGNVFDEKAVKYGDSIVLPASNPTKDYHVFKGWLDVPATMPATNITIQPIFERVPVRLVAAEGSTTVIDRETGIITGLTTRMNDTIAAQYLAVEGDGYYTITAVGSYSRYGTGAKVEVFDRADTSAPVETFYIVIYGDLNGDGDISASDASIVENEVLYVTQWSWGSTKDAVKVMAADLVKDGYIQTNDADAIVNTTLGIASIDQATGTVVR